ncbi:MAG: translation elongation factor-like protein [Deltaproteobacteria bacterium]|nr:translation elongation factor-like protein [Deltaproteobacteria bacterium]
MAEEIKVGEVIKFFAKPSVAAVKITEGEVALGDTLHYMGHTTDFEETVNSLQIENQDVQKASAGDLVGIKVKERVREHDAVYKKVS